MKYRVYYNRSEDAPLVWSVDEGSHASEINVQNVVLVAAATTRFNPDAQLPEPKAWLEISGQLRIQGGKAYIE
jgi:hypothetical protein